MSPTSGNPRRDWVYDGSWWIVQGFSRLYFRLEAHGVHHVPRHGPVIIASNHLSYLDPPLLGCVIPRIVNFLARHTLFEVPGLGAIIRRYHAVPVDRESGSSGLRTILDKLQAGGCIILFPEGTRSENGSPLSAKPGIGMTVLKSRAPVVPVRISGTFEAFGRRHWIPRPRKVTLYFGEPLAFADERTEALQCDRARLKALYQIVADRLMSEVSALPLKR